MQENDEFSFDVHTSTPLTLLVRSFSDPGDADESKLLSILRVVAQYMHRHVIGHGQIIWEQGKPSDGLYIVESGVLHVNTRFGPGSNVSETILPGTIAGELDFLSGRSRSGTCIAEIINDFGLTNETGIVWKLEQAGLEQAIEEDAAAVSAFIRLCLGYTAQNVGALMAFAFHVA